MSIASQITRLQNAKAALKTSIEAKGVTVASDATLDAYPALVDSILSGGSSSEIDEYIEENDIQYEISNEVVYQCIQAASLSGDAHSWLDYSSEEGYESLSVAGLLQITNPLIRFKSVKLYFCSGDEFETEDSWEMSPITVVAKTDFVVYCLNGYSKLPLDNFIITYQ